MTRTDHTSSDRRSDSLPAELAKVSVTAAESASSPSNTAMNAGGYVDGVLASVRIRLLDRITALADAGLELPTPAELADLITASVPTAGPEEIDPHFAEVGPFYDSSSAMVQLGGITKQALDSRRTHQSVLAMQTGDGQWLYPAWQFNGSGRVHSALVPVFKGLREMDRWSAGVWLIAAHPDLAGMSPRQALRNDASPADIARLAEHDKTALVA